MSLQTSENQQALGKILDMTRFIAIAILILHFYYYCYGAFRQWGLTHEVTDRLMGNIHNTGLFTSLIRSKLIALGFLVISMLGVRGKKDEALDHKTALIHIIFGSVAYFISYIVLSLSFTVTFKAAIYMIITSSGFLLVLTGGTFFSRIIKDKLNNDIFNRENETFPQEERLLENEYSINLPARYRLKNKVRNSWLNFINPFRGLLVVGIPGAGKSYFVIRHIISQHIEKGFTMFVYDFKFPDLSVIAYNHWLKSKGKSGKPLQFFYINFDDLNRSHRCNALDPSAMLDITDASESARTILLGLNREWIKKQGDFFIESPINFLTAIIWYLRKYNDGEFCTLPHVIELMQADYDSLFTLLRTEKEIEVLINPFINAYLNDVMEQLEGQIASAKVAMARLASPQLYYVLSGNDFTLDINNPDDPKVVCMGNNPQKIQIYGAVLSLYVNRLVKQVNQKGKIKSSLIFDEFPTIYLNGIDSLIATARSNKVATCLGVQDFSQMRKDYGREQADVIVNITGNIVSGQVVGDTARSLSERFGKIMQDRVSYSINSGDTSISKSKQLESAIPPSKIAGLSSGEFVGMVADDPTQKIAQKVFHCEIINDHEALKAEEDAYKPIPEVRSVTNAMVQRNFMQIRQDIQDIISSEMERLLDDPAQRHLVIKK
ncbi:MAG: YWFCY domain-containing protein [Flavobacteriia bacterium]|uniref:conjugal transfer protein MobC n=1 Tax=uncultured Flavobacterium sp. TaxID=165435 RepID=UPI00095DA47C|nr:conjugal transfer protein MobC [uncultured Flavobacterium sp.]MBN9294277.1 YWFCY domain-containing protein [Flavobacteriia bacterium]OJX36607.1 MAG: conjugal transfer protein TraG [Flavobacteriia bacterium 40-80]